MTDPQDSVKARIHADLTAAMKSRDEITTSTLRMVLSAFTNAEVAGAEAIELDAEQSMAVLQAEAKKRTESAELYAGAGRDELAAKERAELAVIERYLPAALSDEQLDALVSAAVAEVAAGGGAGPKAIGQVIKLVRDRAGASADGARIAAAAKAALSG